MPKLSDREFDNLREYIYEVSGISLDDSKEYLIETRLNPILDKFDLDSFDELLRETKQDKTGELKEHIISAISTNETLFFRDEKPFNLLENKLIPDLIDKKSTKYNSPIPLKIWSAGCSYGQEVYSIIITLLEMLPNPAEYDIDVLGTDISNNAIKRASYGKYSEFEVDRGLPNKYRKKYFHKQGNGWRINDRVRMHARFKIVNLMQSFNDLGPFDIIFCRNVAIYFSRSDKIRLYRNISRVLKKYGYLILGGSENLTGIPVPFAPQHYLRTIFYTLEDNKSYSKQGEKEKNIKSRSGGKRRKSNIFKKVKKRRRKKSGKKNKSSKKESIKESKPKEKSPINTKSKDYKKRKKSSSRKKADKKKKSLNLKNKDQPKATSSQNKKETSPNKEKSQDKNLFSKTTKEGKGNGSFLNSLRKKSSHSEEQEKSEKKPLLDKLRE